MSTSTLSAASSTAAPVSAPTSEIRAHVVKGKTKLKAKKAMARLVDGSKKAATGVRPREASPHSVAINTPVQPQPGSQPLPLATQEPQEAARAPAGVPQHQGAAGVAAAEHNPLWSLLREVTGPEEANPAEAEVVPGTISEETKDEEQQDEDEEKLAFD